MGGVFDSDEEFNEYYGGNDLSGLRCPRCGCNDVRVVRLPRSDGWWGRVGRATCRHCGCQFGIRAIEEEVELDVE